MASDADGRLKYFIEDILRNYDRLRGDVGSFWDVVVLTACDADQEKGFQCQLQAKLRQNTIPPCRYLVVPDHPPVGVEECKIGAGGSTFLVIEKLREDFSPDELKTKKILLIHAGGWSQRLPSASVLGKLFMPLPIGPAGDYDMLDVKLALYMPFIPLMSPGIFLTASDDIELYYFDVDRFRTVHPTPRPGCVALGHPSTTEIGATHGVFACDIPFDAINASYLPCLTVLQKPSVEDMRKCGAIHSFGGAGDGSAVITDSAYWFDMDIVDKLEMFYRQHGLPAFDVDCYGDFMQPLGTKPSTDYIEGTKNSKLKEVRQELFDVLSGSPFDVLFLPGQYLKIAAIPDKNTIIFSGSLFVHLGTIPEYLDCLLKNPTFRDCFAVTSNVMHSILHDQCTISSQSILEYCYFLTPVVIGDRCLISGCSTESMSSWTTETSLNIPPGTFMHTVVLKIDGERQYCTIFCGINDDIKASVSVSEISRLKLFGNPVGDFLSSVLKTLATGASNISIWDLSIFPICRFPGQSFLESLRLIKAIHNTEHFTAQSDRRHVSMADVLKWKDIDGMIEYRERLRVPVLATDKAAQQILHAGIEAVKPAPLIRQHVQLAGNVMTITNFDGHVSFERHLRESKVWIVAVGKAAPGMMEGLLEVLDDAVVGAVMLVPTEIRKQLSNSLRDRRLNVLFGGHDNMPDEDSVQSTREVIAFIQQIHAPDIFLCAVSGGSSALLVAPRFPVTLAEKTAVVKALMKSGVPIQELNVVRGALSAIKSGGLLTHLQPGVSCATVILSDIVGDPVHIIGGGPTVHSKMAANTVQAVTILQKYQLWDTLPKSVKTTLENVDDAVVPREDKNVGNILIGNNTVAVRTCHHKAVQLGYQTANLTTSLVGESRTASKIFAEFVEDVSLYRQGKSKTEPVLPFLSDHPPARIDWTLPFCLISGGETTVRVVGSGKGGRNQEMALAFAVALHDLSLGQDLSGVFLSCGTDGQDGPTNAGGALVRFPTVWSEDAKTRAVAALENNDSYNFFANGGQAAGVLLKPGMTGTNVMDLQILLVD